MQYDQYGNPVQDNTLQNVALAGLGAAALAGGAYGLHRAGKINLPFLSTPSVAKAAEGVSPAVANAVEQRHTQLIKKGQPNSATLPSHTLSFEDPVQANRALAYLTHDDRKNMGVQIQNVSMGAAAPGRPKMVEVAAPPDVIQSLQTLKAADVMQAGGVTSTPPVVPTAATPTSHSSSVSPEVAQAVEARKAELFNPQKELAVNPNMDEGMGVFF